MEIVSRVILTFVVNALWQIPLLAAAAVMGAWLLRRCPARYQYWLWVSALALCLFLPILSLRVPLPANTGQGALAGGSVDLPVPALAPQVFPAWEAGGAQRPASGVASAGRLTWRHLRRRTLTLSTSLPVVLGVTIAYLLLLLTRLVRLIVAWWRTAELRRTAREHSLPAHVLSLVRRCEASFGSPPVSILISPALRSPVTLGVLHPAIILPEHLLQPPEEPDLAVALVHEMAHVRRRDFAVNLLLELAYSPVVFHPAAKWLKRAVEEARELACDEMATEQLAAPKTYARSLVRMAKAMTNPATQARPDCSLGVFDANILEKRVMRILEKRPRLTVLRAAALILTSGALLAATGFAASMLSVRPEEPQGRGAVIEGVKSGFVGGVAGGVVEGIVNGVPGGILGGIPSESASTHHGGSPSIRGTVFDPSGARVPDAEVTVTNEKTGKRLKTMTDQTGDFSFTGLVAGEYSVEVEKRGFAVFHQQEFKLGPGVKGPELAISLQPGEVIENVEVTALAIPGASKPEEPKRPQRIRVGGLVEAAKLVHMEHPAYSEEARKRGVQGVVLLQAVISMQGEPLSLKVLSSPDPELSQSAVEAVKKWRYQPTLLNGEPIEVVTTIAVGFHLVQELPSPAP